MTELTPTTLCQVFQHGMERGRQQNDGHSPAAREAVSSPGSRLAADGWWSPAVLECAFLRSPAAIRLRIGGRVCGRI